MGTSVGWGDWQNFRRMGGPLSPPRKKPCYSSNSTRIRESIPEMIRVASIWWESTLLNESYALVSYSNYNGYNQVCFPQTGMKLHPWFSELWHLGPLSSLVSNSIVQKVAWKVFSFTVSHCRCSYVHNVNRVSNLCKNRQERGVLFFSHLCVRYFCQILGVFYEFAWKFQQNELL